MDSHYSNLLIVREGELVPNGTFLIYGRERIKSDHDIKHAKINIWKREIKKTIISLTRENKCVTIF